MWKWTLTSFMAWSEGRRKRLTWICPPMPCFSLDLPFPHWQNWLPVEVGHWSLLAPFLCLPHLYHFFPNSWQPCALLQPYPFQREGGFRSPLSLRACRGVTLAGRGRKRAMFNLMEYFWTRTSDSPCRLLRDLRIAQLEMPLSLCNGGLQPSAHGGGITVLILVLCPTNVWTPEMQGFSQICLCLWDSRCSIPILSQQEKENPRCD